MTPEELVDPDVLAWREWFHERLGKWAPSLKEDTLKGRLDNTEQARAYLAGARMARENWTPPEPVVDPDILAWREYFAKIRPEHRKRILRGEWDRISNADFFLAGARMAREQERERANHPIAFAVRVMAGVFKDLGHAEREARAALAKYQETL